MLLESSSGMVGEDNEGVYDFVWSEKRLIAFEDKDARPWSQFAKTDSSRSSSKSESLSNEDQGFSFNWLSLDLLRPKFFDFRRRWNFLKFQKKLNLMNS